jgi:Viral BACON domain
VYKGSASPFLTPASNTVAIEAFANSKKTVALTANVSWTAISDQSWLTVTPASGFGDSTLSFTAQENPTTATRTATVTLTANGVANQVITITQDAGGVPYLLVTPASMDFLYQTNTPKNISITSNVAWTAVSDQPWLTLSANSGTGIAVITASAADYTGTPNRSATITITGEGLPANIITVTQNGAPIVLTLPINFELDGTYVFTNFDGGTGSVVANPFATGSNASNKVGRIIRNGGALWAGSFLTINNKFNFSTLTTFSMKVFSPRVGLPVLLKLEGDVGPSEITATTTMANTWETLNWNFVGKPSNVYNKLVLMFDFGTVGNGSANSTFYFDDIEQIAQPIVANWTGNVNTAWENAGNWSSNSVPTASTIVQIPAGRPRYPTVNATTTVKSISAAPGTTVTVAPGVELNVLK